jgi:hypothetical protein
MKVPAAKKTYSKSYANLRGIDLANIPSMVAPERSPDCLNVYKDYHSTIGQAIETRPGFLKVLEAADTINGIHRFGSEVLLHYGSNLKKWTGFPSTSTLANLSGTFTISDNPSISFPFEGKLYIMDGTHFLVYNGTTVADVTGYIPTTRISADPDGGNGEALEGVNLLSSYRKNTFVGDGTSTVFTLDATGIDAETPTVTVNGTSATVNTYNTTNGTVTLSSAPAAPSTPGEANVVITFKKTVSGAFNKIAKCTIARVFDGRVFYTGNPDYKGYIFVSELENAAYIRDDNYYNDGDDNVKITSLISAPGALVAVKDHAGWNTTKVFYHTPSIDYELGKVYPVTDTGINLGSVAGGINFLDDIVYLSDNGLESIQLMSGSAALVHRSVFVDRKLANSSSLASSSMIVWDGYLCILCGSEMFLADSRQLANGAYEWYYWNNMQCENSSDVVEEGAGLYEHDGSLFFYTDTCICSFTGTNDAGEIIYSYWTTPRDVFGAPAYLKTVTKRGATAWIKDVQNSEMKIGCLTDRGESLLKEINTGGFDFGDIDFGAFVFSSVGDSLIIFNIKKKKIMYFSLIFYTDTLDKPFALYSAGLEYQVIKHAKEG